MSGANGSPSETEVLKQVLADIRKELTVEKMSRAFIATSTSEFPATSSYNKPGILQHRTMNRMYEQGALIRMVVDTKINMVKMIPWDIVPKDKEYDLTPGDEMVKGRLLELLHNCNQNGETFDDLLHKVMKDLLVLDAGCIEKVRDGYGDIVELYAIDGATITPIVDEHGMLGQYQQKIRPTATYYGLQSGIGFEEKQVDFPPQDIIYLMTNPSTSRVWGRSPLETLTVEVGADLYALNYNAMYFVEGSFMDKILVMGKIGQIALERIQQKIQLAKGQGHKLGIINDLEDGGKGAKVLSLRDSPRDMEFTAFEEWLFKRICGVYQISANDVMELYQSATRASAETQKRISEHKGLQPIIQLLERKINKEIVREFSDTLSFKFVIDPFSDPKGKADHFATRVEGGYPINRALKDMGEEPLEMMVTAPNGQDVNLFDLPQQVWATLLTPEQQVQAEAALQPLRLQKGGAKKKVRRVRLPQQNWVKEAEPEMTRSERGLKRLYGDLADAVVLAVTRHSRALRDAIEHRQRLARISTKHDGTTIAKQGGGEFDALIDKIVLDALGRVKWEDEFVSSMSPQLASAYRKGASRTTSLLSVTFDSDTYNQRAVDYLKEHFYDKGVLFEIRDHLKESLGSQISGAVAEGKTYEEIRDALADQIKEATPAEISRIVRSEVINAANQGTFQSWSEEAGIEKFDFIIAPDACPICQAIANGGRPADYEVAEKVSGVVRFQEFKGNPYHLNDMGDVGEYGDGYPHPNCRDVWAPSTTLEEAEAAVEAR